jgi:hypothetical protein
MILTPLQQSLDLGLEEELQKGNSLDWSEGG